MVFFNQLASIWWFPEIGLPPNHPYFSGMFPDKNHLCWVSPISGNPMKMIKKWDNQETLMEWFQWKNHMVFSCFSPGFQVPTSPQPLPQVERHASRAHGRWSHLGLGPLLVRLHAERQRRERQHEPSNQHAVHRSTRGVGGDGRGWWMDGKIKGFLAEMGWVTTVLWLLLAWLDRILDDLAIHLRRILEKMGILRICTVNEASCLASLGCPEAISHWVLPCLTGHQYDLWVLEFLIRLLDPLLPNCWCPSLFPGGSCHKWYGSLWYCSWSF